MTDLTLDFASQLDYLQALAPEIVLTLTALAVLLVDVFQREDREEPSSEWIPRLSLGGLVLAGVATAYVFFLRTAGPGGLVALDSLRVASAFVLLGGTFLGLLFADDYLEREGLRIGEFYVLVLFATVGMMVLVAAEDLIVTFLGLETMSIAAYVLTGFNRDDPRSSEAALKYFLVGAFASAFFVYGIALLYGATGTTHLAEMAPRAAAALGGGSLILSGGVGLLLVGFAFKVAAVPFHMWAPDAYQGAPTPVTGYMAAAVKSAGFLALIRVLTHLEPARGLWESVVWWLAMLTMIVPNLVALAQDDVKRMLAYSSVAHAGYVFVGITAGGDAGVASALFYLGVYTLMTLGGFAVVYVVAGKGDRRSSLADFRGLGWRRPVLGAVMVLFLLSLAGFPPTGGFVGKLYLLRAAVGTGQIVLAVTLVLTSLVAYFYYLRVVWKMYFEEAPEGLVAPASTGGAFRTAAALCAAGVLVTGLLPGAAIRGAEAMAEGRPRPAPRAAAVGTVPYAGGGGGAPVPASAPADDAVPGAPAARETDAAAGRPATDDH